MLTRDTCHTGEKQQQQQKTNKQKQEPVSSISRRVARDRGVPCRVSPRFGPTDRLHCEPSFSPREDDLDLRNYLLRCMKNLKQLKHFAIVKKHFLNIMALGLFYFKSVYCLNSSLVSLLVVHIPLYVILFGNY